jgi:hypothetical protein
MAPNERLIEIITSTPAWEAWKNHYTVQINGIGRPPYTCAEAHLAPHSPDTISSIRRQLMGMTQFRDVTLELMNTYLGEYGLSASLELQIREDNKVGVHFSPDSQGGDSPYMEFFDNS